jgi:hypothetical protein
MLPAKLATASGDRRIERCRDRASSNRRRPVPPVSSGQYSAGTAYDNRSDGFTSGTAFWTVDMPFVSGVETVPVVVMHDVGNGSRIIVGPIYMHRSDFKEWGGFLAGMIPDAFISNVINQHGSY